MAFLSQSAITFSGKERDTRECARFLQKYEILAASPCFKFTTDRQKIENLELFLTGPAASYVAAKNKKLNFDEPNPLLRPIWDKYKQDFQAWYQ